MKKEKKEIFTPQFTIILAGIVLLIFTFLPSTIINVPEHHIAVIQGTKKGYPEITVFTPGIHFKLFQDESTITYFDLRPKTFVYDENGVEIQQNI